jgi:Peptidase family S41
MLLRAPGVLAILTLFAAQGVSTVVKNGGFEEGDAGGVPAGWIASPASTAAGYRVVLSDESPKSGVRAAMLVRDLDAKVPGFGNLMQRLDATPFRDRRVTLRASVRTAPGSRAQLWMRVDRAAGQTGFFDNMADRPIVSASWAEYRIEGNVHHDATDIYLGLMLQGEGKAWLDDVSMDSVALTVRPAAPPRPFAGRGLDNVVAFTRLLGYVRYFHPSDEAARADWDAFAIEGVDAVEAARTPDALARLLEERFRPLAPTLRVFTGAAPAVPPELRPSPAARRVAMWRHRGVGIRPPVYESERLMPESADGRLPDGIANPAEPLIVDLGAGVKAALPLALWSDGTGTLPRRVAPPAGAAPISTSAADRATRLAAVALAWNVFQHFYPYFDVVQADWPRSLRTALASAARDDERSFAATLRRLVVDLHDGHGSVTSGPADRIARLPLAWDWIEGELVVTDVGPGETAIRRGDVIEAIDRTPSAAALAAEERLISGATPQWRQYRALGELLRGAPGEVTLTVLSDGASREVRMRRTAGMPVVEQRPDKLAEIRPGIFYVDPTRLTDQEFTAALPQLAKASGIVFEMRGYPRMSPRFIQHLIATPVQSAQWLVPVVTRPDREGVTYDGGGRWNLVPMAPRLTAPVAFVTNGRAISYAESCMGIIEHYKLGEIVGAPTAGTNGNVNPFTLPGGYTVVWTGMKVLKHDGSQHHGVGIQPTILVSRTIKGVREGRDEILERAIEAVRR